MEKIRKSGKERRAEIVSKRKSRREKKILLLRAAAFAFGMARPISDEFRRLYERAPHYPGWPVFIRQGFYEDKRFQCVDCGAWSVWKAERQKWWYEEARGHWDSTAIRCAACREKRRLHREAARKTWQDRAANKMKKKQLI